MTQTRAAERLRLSQPDVSKLMSGRHSGFSVDRLLSLLNALEVDIDIVVRPRFHPRPASRGVVRLLAAAGYETIPMQQQAPLTARTGAIIFT